MASNGSLRALAGERRRVQLICKDPSRTKQSEKDKCDVNNIMAKYLRTGQITHLARRRGVFADVSNVGDFREALDTVSRGRAMFAALDSDTRGKFGNDPGLFLEFASNPVNADELRKMGVLPPLNERPAASVEPAPAGSVDEKKEDQKSSK